MEKIEQTRTWCNNITTAMIGIRLKNIIGYISLNECSSMEAIASNNSTGERENVGQHNASVFRRFFVFAWSVLMRTTFIARTTTWNLTQPISAQRSTNTGMPARWYKDGWLKAQRKSPGKVFRYNRGHDHGESDIWKAINPQVAFEVFLEQMEDHRFGEFFMSFRCKLAQR